jgi:outer membrane receptor protein involved in Fe transport
VWTPKANSALRFSIGSTFQSPQLPTFIVLPNATAAVDGYISIGNPHATAERATSLDLGYEHLLHLATDPAHISADIYRTNLHNGVATYLAPPVAGGTCSDQTPCLSYPVNVTQGSLRRNELRRFMTSIAFTLRGTRTPRPTACRWASNP